jgi:hypothetical protein
VAPRLQAIGVYIYTYGAGERGSVRGIRLCHEFGLGRCLAVSDVGVSQVGVPKRRETT